MVAATAGFLRSRIHASGFIRAELCVGMPKLAVVIFGGRAKDHRLVRAQAADTNADFFIHKSGIRRNLEEDDLSG